VAWHPQLFSDGVEAIKAQLDKTLDHFTDLAQLEALFAKRSGVGHRSVAYRLFHRPEWREGVGRGARPAAEKVSEEDRFSKLHCSRCVKRLIDDTRHHSKAPNNV
jgi:hypothetical protein